LIADSLNKYPGGSGQENPGRKYFMAIRKMTSHRILIIFLMPLIVSLYSCFSVKYSMSGASISPDVKTVSIQYFQNNATLVNPSLSQQFTDALKDKFVSQTGLKLINGTGDLNFEGEITDYNTKPMAIQENDIAARNRLTVTIKVRYSNSKDPEAKYDFDKTFTRFEDYDSSKDLRSVEDELTKKIIDQIVEDVFNQSVVNW
jgi:hypothetical protein